MRSDDDVVHKIAVESLDEKSRDLATKIKFLDAKLTETKNMLAILTKAKNSYIADLKLEMLADKAGLDLDLE